jgi:hypothetical protein
MTMRSRRMALITAIAAMIAGPALAQTSSAKIEAAITTIRILDRPGRDNLATAWDGNKYVQCRRMRDRALRCEAAGTLMQVSLERVLTPDRIGRLAAMGWMLDPSFGNYVQIFRPDASAKEIADKLIAALAQGYDADIQNLEVETKSIASEPCPPRNGPSQNLAGIINDEPSMAATAVHACAYKAKNEPKRKLGPGDTALATEVLTLLHDVYGYYGASKLKVMTEED